MSNLRRCNRTQARAEGLVDGIWIDYGSPVYENYPLGFSPRCAYPATGIAQRNVRYRRTGSCPSLLYFVHPDELQVHPLDQRRM